MRILIADDHDLLRDALMLYIEGQDGLEAEAAADLAEAEARIAAGGTFDVVLLDFTMPGMNGLDGLKRLLALPGGQRVAIMSGTAGRETAEQALAAGAAGFLPKTLPARSLVNAVRFIAMGEQYAPLSLMCADAPEDAHPMAAKLTGRETEVLEGLTQGKSNKEIARDLGLREPTVKLHLQALYRKIGASNRTQAAVMARGEGLF